MKFGKKLLAAVLAGVLALTMLTACSGGSGSTSGSIDPEASKAAAEVINKRRMDNSKSELTLSLEASQKLAAWAKASAVQHANNTSATQKATEEARIAAKNAVRAMKINGKEVKVWKTYSYAGTTAEAAEKALADHPDWFLDESEDACNYVAIATYGGGEEAATVVLMMLVK